MRVMMLVLGSGVRGHAGILCAREQSQLWEVAAECSLQFPSSLRLASEGQ